MNPVTPPTCEACLQNIATTIRCSNTRCNKWSCSTCHEDAMRQIGGMDDVRSTFRQNGGCDHSVNICPCCFYLACKVCPNVPIFFFRPITKPSNDVNDIPMVSANDEKHGLLFTAFLGFLLVVLAFAYFMPCLFVLTEHLSKESLRTKKRKSRNVWQQNISVCCKQNLAMWPRFSVPSKASVRHSRLLIHLRHFRLRNGFSRH